MEVRPFVTTGIAVASAGALVAAMPAIVPSPTPPDVTVSAAVPRSVYEDVALRQSTEDLFNAFFSGYPDTNGPAGVVGLALLFSDEIFGEDTPPSAFIEGGIVGLAAALSGEDNVVNAFFAGGPNDTPGGIVGVADFLTQDDPLANAFVTGGIVGLAAALSGDGTLLNAFFAGGPNDTPGGIVGVADFLTNGVPLVNDFVTGGVVGVADFLTADVPLVNDFVNGGIVGFTEAVLVQAAGDDEVLATGIRSFFSGYPPAGPDDDPPAGLAGIVGLVHFILDALTGGPQLPEDEAGLGGEGAGLTATLLASGAQEDQGTQTFSLQQFGAAARSGLPAANEPLEPSENGITVSTTDLDSDPVDPVETTDPVAVDPVDTTEPVETTEPDPTVTPVAATTGSGSGSAPAASPPVAPTPPPATDPVVDPVVEPVDPVSNEDDAKEVTEEELNSGNKFEPTPILLENGAGGGGSAWDETVKRWQDFGSKLGFGGGAAEPDGGETEGSEAGS